MDRSSRRREKNSMKARIWTAVVGVPLLVLVMYFGGFMLVIGVSFLTLAGILEYTTAINRLIRPKINVLFMIILAAVLVVTIKLDY